MRRGYKKILDKNDYILYNLFIVVICRAILTKFSFELHFIKIASGRASGRINAIYTS